jgi:hypothetical protein
MKKSEAKSQQSAGELEAPVRLTPEQLEIVAAGFKAQLSPFVKGGGTILTGAVSPMQQMQQFLKML